MRLWFRDGFYAGAGLALILGLYLVWLWRPDHQVKLHTRHLFDSMEDRNWSKFSSFLADDYHDQWGQNRTVILERTAEIFGYLRGVRIVPGPVVVETADGKGRWQAKLALEGSNNEMLGLVKDRVNYLTSPFTLEWRRTSRKPWDWHLAKVSNPDLLLPSGFEY